MADQRTRLTLEPNVPPTVICETATSTALLRSFDSGAMWGLLGGWR